MGIYAVKGDELIIPTVYATIGIVLKGADPSGDESTKPSLPVWAQMQSDVSNLDTRVTELEEHGGGGSGIEVSGATIGQTVRIAAVDVSGKPTEWEAVDGRSDWSENNETASGYVKNRPFYTSAPVETVVVEESTVTFEERGGLYGAEFPSTFEAMAGDTYKVFWDGVTYECICVDSNGITVIGNLSIVGAGSDTGEPFSMGIINGERIQIITADSSSSHTFSISATVEPVVKIDKKYLPDNPLNITGAAVGQIVKITAVDGTGKPTSWEPAEFPEQVRSDYEQNDSSAKDYIKNRPFYDSTETTDISGTSINIGAGSSVTHGLIPLQVGQEWKVTAVASGSYEETFIVKENEQGEPYLGTTDAKPVYIRQTETKINSGFINSIGLTALILTCLSGTYTQIVTKKIDPKFLPEIELEAMDKVNPTGTGSFSLNRRPDGGIGDYSFAEGYYTKASGKYSHAENYYTIAHNYYAHAEGSYTNALGVSSHAEGNYTTASSENQHVQGRFNIEDTANTYADIIGNGQFSSRSNAYTLDWDGNAWFAGDVYVGSTSGTNKDNGSKKLATEAYVDERDCVLMSSTPNSTKKFKITVDDSGVLSAIEITA